MNIEPPIQNVRPPGDPGLACAPADSEIARDLPAKNGTTSAKLDTTAPLPGLPIAILGVPFDNVTTADALHQIEAMVASRQPHYLVTANVDFLVQALEDVELRRILFDAHLVLCDGTPLVWASRLLGNPLPERVAGSDLVPLLIRVAAEKKHRLFFLGATPESVSLAVAKLEKKHPGLIVAGFYSPPFNKLLEMDHDEIKRRILEAKPDLLLVCFGCPKQEKWISMHYRSLGVPVTAGVGATIDFLAGRVKRAPRWMQRVGAEWLFRLAQEPRRLFRRYFKDLWVFSWSILGQWRHMRSRSRTHVHAEFSTPVRADALMQWVRLPERLDLVTVRDDALLLDQILADGRHCLLEMTNVKFIDSTGVGLLIHLQKKILATERQLVLLAPSPMVKRALALMHLEDFFATAPDFATAQHLIDTRTREQSAAVAQRTAASASPLAWYGEITAANASAVWERTRGHLVAFAGVREEVEPSKAATEKHHFSFALAPRPTMPRAFLIDLSAVRFIDSTGLGLMVRAKKLANQQGLRLMFAGIQPAVQNVLRLARLEEFLLREVSEKAA